MCFGAVMYQSSMQEIDFTSQKLDPRVTFTRSSGGTYWDASGTMQTAGNNTPRYDYDPATLAFRGLLIEGKRTNLLLNSATGIGQNRSGGNQLGGWVQRVRIYPGRLANAELQAMTT